MKSVPWTCFYRGSSSGLKRGNKPLKKWHIRQSAERVTRSIDESLERLHLDYVDILQCHDIEFGSLDQMNSLSSLLKVCHQLPEDGLLAYEAGRFNVQTRQEKLIADVGCEPIPHMRHFQATKRLPDKLIHQILDKCRNGRPISYS